MLIIIRRNKDSNFLNVSGRSTYASGENNSDYD